METPIVTADKNVAVSTAANVSEATRKAGCIWGLTALGVMLGMFVFGFNVGRNEGKREKIKEYESALDQWSKTYEDQRNYSKEYKEMWLNELHKRQNNERRNQKND